MIDCAKITKTETGFSVQAASIAVSYPAAHENQTPLAQRVLQVGERLRDGTVVLSVDLDKNEASFVPANIFGGKAAFSEQDNVVKAVNKDGLHGHNDWRPITDAEGEQLSKIWVQVAPIYLQGRDTPRFWLALPAPFGDGRARRGGEADWEYRYRYYSLPVPVVRSGPARLDI